MRYYLDAPPIIYLVEQRLPLAAAVRSKLATPGIVPITPMHDGNLMLLQDFDDYFANSIAEIVSLTREVIDRATEIRAQYNFKTPDSIHLAAAVVSNSDVFLTNDHRLNRYPGINIEII
jgi:predicted nucleic acid-binding protein